MRRRQRHGFECGGEERSTAILSPGGLSFSQADDQRAQGNEQKTLYTKHHEQKSGCDHDQSSRWRERRGVRLAIGKPGQQKDSEDDKASFHSIGEPSNSHRAEQARQSSYAREPTGRDARERRANAATVPMSARYTTVDVALASSELAVRPRRMARRPT